MFNGIDDPQAPWWCPSGAIFSDSGPLGLKPEPI